MSAEPYRISLTLYRERRRALLALVGRARRNNGDPDFIRAEIAALRSNPRRED